MPIPRDVYSRQLFRVDIKLTNFIINNIDDIFLIEEEVEILHYLNFNRTRPVRDRPGRQFTPDHLYIRTVLPLDRNLEDFIRNENTYLTERVRYYTGKCLTIIRNNPTKIKKIIKVLKRLVYYINRIPIYQEIKNSILNNYLQN